MDTLTEKMIDKLRSDFKLVADHRVEKGDWTKDEAKEFGQCIKDCIDRNDLMMLNSWAVWISDLAHSLTTFALIVRNAEVRIRAAALEAKTAAATGGNRRG